MPKWTKPSEALPKVETGDRVIVIVHEVNPRTAKFCFRAVVLEATEDSWYSIDETYHGYTPEDGVLWTTEKDLCGIAASMKKAGEL